MAGASVPQAWPASRTSRFLKRGWRSSDVLWRRALTNIHHLPFPRCAIHRLHSRTRALYYGHHHHGQAVRFAGHSAPAGDNLINAAVSAERGSQLICRNLARQIPQVDVHQSTLSRCLQRVWRTALASGSAPRARGTLREKDACIEVSPGSGLFCALFLFGLHEATAPKDCSVENLERMGIYLTAKARSTF